MVDTLKVPDLGRLEIVETYAYYDEPVLFSCKNAAGQFYLVVAADENDQYETWLYAKVSIERLNLIRSDIIDLHDAFADTEDGSVFQVRFSYDQTEPITESVQSNQISEDMLPIPGEYLELEIDTLPLLSNAEEIAKSRNQEILNLILKSAEESNTKIPITFLSKIFGKLQDVINSIGMIYDNSGCSPKDMKHKMQMSLVGIGAGSFDIRLASEKITQLDLLGYSDHGKVIEGVS